MKKSNQIENVQTEASPKTDLGRKIAKYFCIALFSIIAIFMGFAAIANALSGSDPMLDNLENAFKNSSATVQLTTQQWSAAILNLRSANDSFCDTWKALDAYKTMKKLPKTGDKPTNCEGF